MHNSHFMLHFFQRLASQVWRYRILAALLIVVAIFAAEFSLLKLPKANAAYTIANSARFISGDTDYLSRTTSTSNRKTFTYSGWVKRGKLAWEAAIIAAYNSGGGNYAFIGFTAGDKLEAFSGGGGTYTLISSALFRDPAAWLHVVVAVDTTQATASDRVKMYVNGSLITSLSTATYPTQNGDTFFNFASAPNCISGYNCSPPTAWLFDGYMSDAYFIDGSALAPTCFGETDANGYWRPKTYSTASPCAAYGTNGFKLAFGTGSALGTDSAGSNNWATSTNMTAAVSQMTDSPTNSFATVNGVRSELTLSNGNLKVTSTTNNDSSHGSIGFSSASGGKFYYEFTRKDADDVAIAWFVGIAKTSAVLTTTPYNDGDFYLYYSPDGHLYHAGDVGAYGSSWAASGDVVGVAVDMTAGKIWFRKNNGAWPNSGDPTTGANAAFSSLSGDFVPVTTRTGGTSSTASEFNFGQGGQSGLTYDSASGGTFKYTPPSGFKALSTANLPAPTIAVPKNYFDAIAYTGSGATYNVRTSVVSFTTTGTTTWNVPVGVTSVDVLVVGGGGGGGYDAAGGGGAGGYNYQTAVAVTPLSTVTVAVGAGGAGGT